MPSGANDEPSKDLKWKKKTFIRTSVPYHKRYFNIVVGWKVDESLERKFEDFFVIEI